MNKKNLLTLLLIFFVAVFGHAQVISKAEPTPQDYINLLNKQGYYVASLDLSAFEKDKYLMTPVINVYSNGKLQENLFEEFGIGYTNSEPIITVGIVPKSDSLIACNFQFDKKCSIGMTLPLRAVKNESDDSDVFFYQPRPFVAPAEWNENDFIPFLAYSCAWYDPELQTCRNCDVDEFDKDFINSVTFRKSSHVYVFGIKIRKL